MSTTARKKKIPDDELIDMFLASQSPEHFGELYGRYADKVYSKCLSLLKNEAAAQDAAQDIFLKIFLNLAKFNKKSRFSTWVYSITYNYCIDYLRRKKKEKTILTDDENEKDPIDDEVDDKEILEMEIERLAYILTKIPEDDKNVLLMKYQADMSIKDISAAYNKSESAIKMKLKRAKTKVRKLYNENFDEMVTTIILLLWMM